MSPAQLVALGVARDLRLHIEANSIRDVAIDNDVDDRAVVDEARKLMGNMYRAAGVQACRVCGCTQEEGCPEGCSWAEEDLCSECAAPTKRLQGQRR